MTDRLMFEFYNGLPIKPASSKNYEDWETMKHAVLMNADAIMGDLLGSSMEVILPRGTLTRTLVRARDIIVRATVGVRTTMHSSSAEPVITFTMADYAKSSRGLSLSFNVDKNTSAKVKVSEHERDTDLKANQVHMFVSIDGGMRVWLFSKDRYFTCTRTQFCDRLLEELKRETGDDAVAIDLRDGISGLKSI